MTEATRTGYRAAVTLIAPAVLAVSFRTSLTPRQWQRRCLRTRFAGAFASDGRGRFRLHGARLPCYPQWARDAEKSVGVLRRCHSSSWARCFSDPPRDGVHGAGCGRDRGRSRGGAGGSRSMVPSRPANGLGYPRARNPRLRDGNHPQHGDSEPPPEHSRLRGWSLWPLCASHRSGRSYSMSGAPPRPWLCGRSPMKCGDNRRGGLLSECERWLADGAHRDRVSLIGAITHQTPDTSGNSLMPTPHVICVAVTNVVRPPLCAALGQPRRKGRLRVKNVKWLDGKAIDRFIQLRTYDGVMSDGSTPPLVEFETMRYGLTDRAWGAIRPMLPNKPRGVPRVDDRTARGSQAAADALLVAALL